MSHRNIAHHSCNDTCVAWFASQLEIALQNKLESFLKVLPTSITTIVSEYVCFDVGFSDRFSIMHGMLFLRSSEIDRVNHGPMRRLFKHNCVFEVPCFYWERAKTVAFLCEEPRETFVAFQWQTHICNAFCATIVMRAWKKCLVLT